MDNEMNSAEQAAEKILREEEAKVLAEICPKGDNCAVHHRVNELVTDDESEYLRAIDYVGEYVIVTDDNRSGDAALVAALFVALAGGKCDLPPRWETIVYRVGDGSLSDLQPLSNEELKKSIRYRAESDSWEHLKDFHESVVLMVTGGLVDLSEGA